MPRKKKEPTELPDKDAIRELFPRKVVEEAERIAHEHDDPEEENGDSEVPYQKNSE